MLKKGRPNLKKFKAGIAGATGYTGSELIRLLLNHPEVELTAVTSERNAGQEVASIHAQFRGMDKIRLVSLDELEYDALDVLFLALPHKVSMEFIAKYYPLPCPIIDLSGDFRLPTADVYECWYGEVHKIPELLSKAVFGLPELFRDAIKKATLIANPGCYPTSTILPLVPLLREKLIDSQSIVVDAKSGTTGAGASAKEGTHFPNVADNFSAYGLKTHRHTPEIELTLEKACGTRPLIQFTPHLLPVNRGILTCTYSSAIKETSPKKLEELFLDSYGQEYFVRITKEPPQLKHVRGSNFCDIFITYDNRTNRIITVSAIDNLMKGAAGQAVQNMNIVLGLDEHSGLKMAPVCP